MPGVNSSRIASIAGENEADISGVYTTTLHPQRKLPSCSFAFAGFSVRMIPLKFRIFNFCFPRRVTIVALFADPVHS